MTGWCTACGNYQRVPSGRGDRLADHACAICGNKPLVGTLKAKRLGLLVAKFPVPCQHPSCISSFRTEEDASDHFDRAHAEPLARRASKGGTPR